MKSMRHRLAVFFPKYGRGPTVAQRAAPLQRLGFASARRAALLQKMFCLSLVAVTFSLSSCQPSGPSITVGSKFFTEQVVLGELLAQHIEARTGIHVERKTNLGGTLLCQKALESGQLDLYVEYTGTALTAVLNESPSGDPAAVIYERVKKGYADRFNLEVTEALGFENTFAMVVRAADAQQFHLTKISDIIPIAARWRAGVGYEFLERPDGYAGFSQRYGLHFAAQPSVMDLGLIYRALVDKKV